LFDVDGHLVTIRRTKPGAASMDLRSGEESTDMSRGGYGFDRIPLDRLADIDLKPDRLHDFVVAIGGALRAEIEPAPTGAAAGA
jgi:hypothetical protein